MSERPTVSNADEWQLWLIEGPLAGAPDVNVAYLAVQIVEAIEEHQKALAREVYGLREQTETEWEGVAKLDLEGKQGAYARGRIHEAKTIARAINAIMPYSRDIGALGNGGRQRLAGWPEPPPLTKRPVAFMRGVTTPGSPHGPAEHDVEFVYGDDKPEGEGWIALYRRKSC